MGASSAQLGGEAEGGCGSGRRWTTTSAGAPVVGQIQKGIDGAPDRPSLQGDAVGLKVSALRDAPIGKQQQFRWAGSHDACRRQLQAVGPPVEGWWLPSAN